jgi:hypothetical protein
MPDSNPVSSIQRSVKTIATLGGALSGGLPGAAYFTHNAPPLFALTALVSGGVGVAVFVYVFLIRPDARRAARNAVRILIAAVFLGAAYGLLLTLLSVAPPTDAQTDGVRFQIGFRMADFSLTADGRAKRDQLDLRTPEDLMLAYGGYEQGTTYRIWQTWTIIASGILLIVLFVVTFILWAYGLALLAWSLSKQPSAQDAPERNLTDAAPSQIVKAGDRHE